MSDTIKILFIGDIVGKPGRRTVSALLPGIKKEENIMLSVSEICEILKITERHLSREFKQWYNKKPIEIFRDIKLDYACGLLCTSMKQS